MAEIPGCMDNTACNYSADANTDDGSCLQLDECGVCGGAGIAEACDCAGNVPDECAYVAVLESLKARATATATSLTNGVCGGAGIAEGACDCAGNVLDECGVCGGAGIAEGACDCDGNVLDECGRAEVLESPKARATAKETWPTSWAWRCLHRGCGGRHL